MPKRLLALVAAFTFAASCGGRGEQTPTPPPLDRQDLSRALLAQQDAGDAWEQTESPGPNTVQIGGRVGAANVRPAAAEATSAFDQKEGSGFVSNSILLVASEEVAQAVIAAHEDAALTSTWDQERDDGGLARFTIDGPVPDLPALGDRMYATRLNVVITTAEGQTSENSVEYVVFSVGPLVAFVVAQDTEAAQLARRVEARVATLLRP